MVHASPLAPPSITSQQCIRIRGISRKRERPIGPGSWKWQADGYVKQRKSNTRITIFEKRLEAFPGYEDEKTTDGRIHRQEQGQRGEGPLVERFDDERLSDSIKIHQRVFAQADQRQDRI